MSNTRISVLGGSRGVGRAIVTTAAAAGYEVLAVARDETSLAELAAVRTAVCDVTDAALVEDLLRDFGPHAIVLAAGAHPANKPLHEQSWSEFTETWEVDVKASFQLCRMALRTPFAPGTRVALISSGAAIGGSPISGGYAGAKRMQMFMADYAQKESDRLGLDVHFVAIAPSRIMPQTALGRDAADGYARYLGISTEDFLKGCCQSNANSFPHDADRSLSAAA